MTDSDHCERCGHLLPEEGYGWCGPCDRAEKQARWEQNACICWATDMAGRSVCGLRCPVHTRENVSVHAHL